MSAKEGDADCRFSVRPVIPLVLSVAMWLLGWTSIYKSGAIIHSVNNVNYIFSTSFQLLVFVFSAAVGPLGVVYYSWSIDVVGSRLVVRKLFGSVEREYYKHEIREVRLIPGGKRKAPEINIVFLDGIRLRVERISLNFKALWIYLQSIGSAEN
jgi:hypothetical protein